MRYKRRRCQCSSSKIIIRKGHALNILILQQQRQRHDGEEQGDCLSITTGTATKLHSSSMVGSCVSLVRSYVVYHKLMSPVLGCPTVHLSTFRNVASRSIMASLAHRAIGRKFFGAIFVGSSFLCRRRARAAAIGMHAKEREKKQEALKGKPCRLVLVLRLIMLLHSLWS